MKFAIEIKMEVEVTIDDISPANVIRDLSFYGNRMELINDDESFGRGAQNQRLLDALKADGNLLAHYTELRALFEAFSALEEGTELSDRFSEQMDEVEQLLIKRLKAEDSKWFSGAIKAGFWSETTEHFNKAFRITVSDPVLCSKTVAL